jgi:rod shape determining protein RodA
MEEYQRRTQFDFSIFLSALALWTFGILLVYSATSIHETGPLVDLYRTQIVWVLMAVLIILAVVSIPTAFYYHGAYVIYGFSLLLLLYAFFTGVEAKGAERWVHIAGIRLQPSEFAKIGLLMGLARYLSTKPISLERITSFIVPVILIGVPFLFIIKQPDLGTAMVLAAMSLPVFFWAGLTLVEAFFLVSPIASLALSMIPLIIGFSLKHSTGILSALPWGVFFLIVIAMLYFRRPPLLVLIATVAANLFTAAGTTIIWNALLKDYQKMRIVSFVNPQQDAAGAGYQVIQSMVAIGSGAFFGKGYLKGTQTRLSYLPEQHTDFIFSVLGEQFGFFGCLIVLCVFLFLIYRGYHTTEFVRNRFTNLLIVGAMSIIAFHVFVNIAMTIGMMPVVGVPLPFLSYGGSFTFTVAVLIGLILNARVSRQDF